MSGLHSAQFSAADEVLRKRILTLDARVKQLEEQQVALLARLDRLAVSAPPMVHLPAHPFQGPVASQPRPAA